MVSRLQPTTQPEAIYPESDGKPMADNTQQFRWIVVVKENLEWLFANDATVFIAGDLLWYPLEGRNDLSTAPDVLVVFGRPKGDRGSYQQWNEAGIAPQVVFEILSPSNTKAEMNRKLLFYDRHGVEEYYLYDPYGNCLNGWRRTEDFLEVIEPIDNWASPRLGIRFDLSGAELQIYRPDGQPFLSYVQIAGQLEQERQAKAQLEQRVEQMETSLEQERALREQEQRRSQALAERLRAMGIDPDQA
ncbi:Uma2 family endonuclease [Kovacikia minuta CCNUW1]|uniref:Uma2 family endonuclease n=1 Tax=Kovacikia minuta TaxID=2931930 RepID=UPI001CCD0F1D|nr:Uma2 family endonuclease [Kovacikia minuta]UBF28492.1 Uma2 family endonuclease [Kovacikia minuta CCNUW1]